MSETAPIPADESDGSLKIFTRYGLFEIVVKTSNLVKNPSVDFSDSQRDAAINLAELAIAHRFGNINGSDPSVLASNNLPESHQRAAMDLIRSIAVRDFPNYRNTFTNRVAVSLYKDEQSWLRYRQEQKAGNVEAIQNR